MLYNLSRECFLRPLGEAATHQEHFENTSKLGTNLGCSWFVDLLTGRERENEMGQARNTILIVDDVELNRDVLSIMFSQSHEIEFAESGPEALDILRKKKEDICAILLDYVMPEMDSLTFLEEAIKEGLVESIPVFLITASLEHDVVHRAYSLGVADYIQRPISPYIAQRRIENIIDLFKTRAAYKKLLEINRTLLERLSEVDDSITDVRNP